MSRQNNRSGFTLIEVLIVVIIMAVLAATIIPQFSSSTADAKESTLKFNLRTMRAQIEMYKIHHNGNYPDAATLAVKLTTKTDVSGNPDINGYGPYMDEVPANPYDNSNTVTAVVVSPPVGPNGDPSGGWQYDEGTGMIYPNHSDWAPAP